MTRRRSPEALYDIAAEEIEEVQEIVEVIEVAEKIELTIEEEIPAQIEEKVISVSTEKTANRRNVPRFSYVRS